jgi:hypothetical protein
MADVPFEEICDSKIRPVLIIDHQIMVFCLKMTSQKPQTKDDYQIKVLEGTGLRKNTVIRTGKMIHLPEGKLIKQIGVLHETDILVLKVLHSIT